MPGLDTQRHDIRARTGVCHDEVLTPFPRLMSRFANAQTRDIFADAALANEPTILCRRFSACRAEQSLRSASVRAQLLLAPALTKIGGPINQTDH